MLNVAVGWRLGRIIVLGQTHGRPWALTPQQARQTLRDMGECPGFEADDDGHIARQVRAERAHRLPGDGGVRLA